MLSLSIIVAGRNQTGASRTEDALTAVITHRHGDHFWPAVDGGPSSSGPPPPSDWAVSCQVDMGGPDTLDVRCLGSLSVFN